MPEYTLLALLAVLISLLLDRVLGTHLVRTQRFWKFQALITLIEIAVNGYLTWRPVVIYGESYQLGLRLFTIPIEDFFYGFALITSNLVIYEFLSRKKEHE